MALQYSSYLSLVDTRLTRLVNIFMSGNVLTGHMGARQTTGATQDDDDEIS
jgi:hypothetical protein